MKLHYIKTEELKYYIILR